MANITTTSKETFTHGHACDLAWMIYLRFGRDMPSAAAAWRRLLQNNCTDAQFADLVEHSDLGAHNPPPSP